MRRFMQSLAFAALVTFAATSAARADAVSDELDAAAHAYALEVPAKLSLKVGETAMLHVAVTPIHPQQGDHVSPDAPVSLAAAAPKAGEPPLPFSIARLRLGREESKATKAQGVEFFLPVTGQAAGKGDLKATLVFYICVAKLCAHQKRELSVPVEVL